jgi:hypothetical protein
MVNKQPRNHFLSPYIQSRKQFTRDWQSDFPCVCIFSCGLHARRVWSYFQKVQWPFVLHILAGILRHEYNGAEYNPLDCTVAGKNRRPWASGRLIKAIIRFNCTNVSLHGLLPRSEPPDNGQTLIQQFSITCHLGNSSAMHPWLYFADRHLALRAA